MKVLVIRFSSIGDIILTTPVVRALKTQMGDCEIHYLTKKSFASLLENNPYIDRVISIDKHVKEVRSLIQSENYDLIIDLHNNLRSLQVKLNCDCRSSSFPKLNIEKWLLVNLKRNVLPDIHIVDRYFRAAEVAGVKNDGKGLDFFIDPADEVVLADPFSDGYTAIVIGAKFNTKKYPAYKVRQLCEKLNDKVVLIGGPEDRKDGSFIADGLSHVYNACGEFSFAGSASLLKKADVVVSNDTGFMHIAAALKLPVISLWGNTVPEFGMYPYLPDELSVIIERKDVSCRPCSKIGFNKCPKGHFNCMELIDPQTILSAIRKLKGSKVKTVPSAL